MPDREFLTELQAEETCASIPCYDCKAMGVRSGKCKIVLNDTVDITPNFCPNCGADMRKGENDG